MSNNPFVNDAAETESKQADILESGDLDVTNLPIEVDVPDIQGVSNDEYIMYRREGLGTSDSSVVLGVNPYKTLDELIQEKRSTTISEEERAIGKKSAVMKGKDLEPLIIKKWSIALGQMIIKPRAQYKHRDFPYLKFNFDGVHYDEEHKMYIPDEIKVVTYRGERHYNTTKNFYDEDIGFLKIPENFSNTNNSIETKAGLYGIPPYYYTQLQQQMLGLNAPYGFLTVLFESTWRVHAFYVYRDEATIRQLILRGSEVWRTIKGGT